jgi:hypothetical protein
MIMNRSVFQAAIRSIYFDQTEFYFSESKAERSTKLTPVDAVVKIEDMHPKHAANAAQKLLREAHIWANEAGMHTSHDSYPQLWMTTTKLFQALTWRAGI